MIASAVVWRGASMLDQHTPIVVALTGLGRPSCNRKTGGMVQSYILVDHVHPLQAIADGRDAAICGDCPHRRRADGSRRCYVNMGTGLSAVYRALPTYPEITLDDAAAYCRYQLVRVGTYGDPAAAPVAVWEAILKHAAGWTGYTHMWRRPEARLLRELLMASCDSQWDRAAAKAAGWRTFRMRRVTPHHVDQLAAGEIVCPASAEAGHRTTCSRCLLCAGTSKRAKDVAIIDHSSAARRRLLVIQ